MTHGGDDALPTTDQVRPALHMLAVSIPLMSAVFGACLRVALSYHQLFHRLDPFLFRLLVGILLVLTTGQVACITAEAWYILTTIVQAREDLMQQRVINACTQVCTTSVALVCQGFYIERLFATTRNLFVRLISIILWMLSISLFIAWNVKYLLHNGPHLNGERKYNLGAASLWALAAATAFVSLNLLYFARQRRLRTPKPNPPLSLASRVYQLASLSVQTFSLVTLNHLASAIGFTASLSTSSNATAACVAFFFFNLFPGLSTYSIIHTLNQRKIELVRRERALKDKKVKHGADASPLARRKRKLSAKEKGKGREHGHEKEGEKVADEHGTGTGMTAEDDPSNWRGDSSLTNSFITGTGLGVVSNASRGPVESAGGGDSRTRKTTSTTLGSEELGESGVDTRRIDLFDRFSCDNDECDEEDEDRDHECDGRKAPDATDDSGAYFSWGVVPAPAARIRPGYSRETSSVERGWSGAGAEDVEKDPRSRGASVQLYEVGADLNWQALEDCRIRPITRR